MDSPTLGSDLGRLVTRLIQRYAWYAIFALILFYVLSPHVMDFFSQRITRENKEETERIEILNEERRRVREKQQDLFQQAALNAPKRPPSVPRQQSSSTRRAPPPARRGGGSTTYRPSIAKRYPRRGGGG